MALTANRDLDHYIDQEMRSFQVAASEHIHKGALVGLSSTGHAKALAAGEKFLGIAFEEADNSGGSAGDLSVRVYTLGDFGHALNGATAADVGRPVFASADDTLTYTGAGNSYVGIVQDVVTDGEIILRIDPGRRQIKTVTHAVEDLAAGADIAARAIHCFDQEGWMVAARVVNQAAAATGIDADDTCVVTLAVGANTVVTATFNNVTAFPAANTEHDLGELDHEHATAGDVLTLAVTNGPNANPGPFLVEVDYI